MGNDQELDQDIVMKLLNETCNEMAKTIRIQQKEIRRLRRECGEGVERIEEEPKKFRVN
ncbi:MAG: hypothetical protein G3M70_14400 [Candidatus Nitronauta litoralis]|uniref:Uncharacterized protein n=1 Tax=Candidatus Nitronauta litoralis TaxID=2705533 RepID=A0A7T0BXX8_9BACT|nr:MAG: hypothetical protein G3M70_14400 [Candidatus Nitronauta litoralis]